MEQSTDDLRAPRLPRTYWIYLAGAVLAAAGFADFSLIAFHFEKTGLVPQVSIPIFYAVAMGASGAGALLSGKLFDQPGMIVLVPLTVMSALSTPLVFLGGYGLALLGAAIWGLGMGVHESIIPAAVALIVPPQRRPSAYGTFTAAYGVFWFAGSALIGLLYDRLLAAVIVFSMLAELTAIPFFLIAGARVPRQQRRTGVLPDLRD
jgi:predicted MFS family arabinose efflux permease